MNGNDFPSPNRPTELTSKVEILAWKHSAMLCGDECTHREFDFNPFPLVRLEGLLDGVSGSLSGEGKTVER